MLPATRSSQSGAVDSLPWRMSVTGRTNSRPEPSSTPTRISPRRTQGHDDPVPQRLGGQREGEEDPRPGADLRPRCLVDLKKGPDEQRDLGQQDGNEAARSEPRLGPQASW